MVIHNDYTTFELLKDNPCEIENCIIYPVKIKDYREFEKCVRYVCVSREHLKISNEESLLQNIIMGFMMQDCEEGFDMASDKTIQSLNNILNELCKLFSIITRTNIRKITTEQGFAFEGDNILIDDKNYDLVRKIICKMCLIKEPKVFENAYAQKWYTKALIAKSKNSMNVDMEDLIIMIVQDMKISFDEVFDMSIFRFNALIRRITSRDNYDRVMNFKLVTDKTPEVHFIDNIIESLYAENDEDLTISSEELNKKI